MVAASAIPGRVPLGFVCGYPVGNGGELYGGSMFIRSAASDTLQGKAIQAANERWGEGRWNGTETIGITVCKKKYAPFQFTVLNSEDPDASDSIQSSNSDLPSPTTAIASGGGKTIRVERLFGCKCHSDLRKAVILEHGVRKGWEPFGQWSMRKAQELARQFTERLQDSSTNATTTNSPTATAGGKLLTCGLISSGVGSSDEELRSMCNNGKCTWKIREKYDNIDREVTGYSSSDEE